MLRSQGYKPWLRTRALADVERSWGRERGLGSVHSTRVGGEMGLPIHVTGGTKVTAGPPSPPTLTVTKSLVATAMGIVDLPIRNIAGQTALFHVEARDSQGQAVGCTSGEETKFAITTADEASLTVNAICQHDLVRATRCMGYFVLLPSWCLPYDCECSRTVVGFVLELFVLSSQFTNDGLPMMSNPLVPVFITITIVKLAQFAVKITPKIANIGPSAVLYIKYDGDDLQGSPYTFPVEPAPPDAAGSVVATSVPVLAVLNQAVTVTVSAKDAYGNAVACSRYPEYGAAFSVAVAAGTTGGGAGAPLSDVATGCGGGSGEVRGGGGVGCCCCAAASVACRRRGAALLTVRVSAACAARVVGGVCVRRACVARRTTRSRSCRGARRSRRR